MGRPKGSKNQPKEAFVADETVNEIEAQETEVDEVEVVEAEAESVEVPVEVPKAKKNEKKADWVKLTDLQYTKVEKDSYSEQIKLEDYCEWNQANKELPGKMAGRAFRSIEALYGLPEFDRERTITVTVTFD